MAALAAMGLAACGSKDESNAVVTAEVSPVVNNAVEIADAPLNNMVVPDEPPPGNDEALTVPRKAAPVPPVDPLNSRCTRLPGITNRAPTVSLRAVSTDGDANGFVVKLQAKATDPDKDKLLYTFTVTAGSISGDGPEVTWRLTEPGLYTASVEADDRRGCLAFVSVSHEVGQPAAR